jgi:cytochrome b involved in lipid metabolism
MTMKRILDQNEKKKTNFFPSQKMQKFSIEQVTAHNSATDCWIIIDNKVYDV